MALPGLEDGSSHQDSHTGDRDPIPWAITCHLPEPASARSWAWRGGMPVPASALTARHEHHHTWLDLSTVHHTGSLTLSSHEWCWFFWHMQALPRPCLRVYFLSQLLSPWLPDRAAAGVGSTRAVCSHSASWSPPRGSCQPWCCHVSVAGMSLAPGR